MKNSIKAAIVAVVTLGVLSACSSGDVREDSAYSVENRDVVTKDNSRMNERVENRNELTAQDQGASDRDIRTTQLIRQRVVEQDSFSMDAKNVKIITLNGNVTLKGPVETMSEKRRIESIAHDVAGVTRVKSEITVVK